MASTRYLNGERNAPPFDKGQTHSQLCQQRPTRTTVVISVAVSPSPPRAPTRPAPPLLRQPGSAKALSFLQTAPAGLKMSEFNTGRVERPHSLTRLPGSTHCSFSLGCTLEETPSKLRSDRNRVVERGGNPASRVGNS